MTFRPITLIAVLLALSFTLVRAQDAGGSPASTQADLRAVLRAYYQNLEARNWDALAAYVLSPKLMERRGLPADSLQVLRDRTRQRELAHAVPPPSHCPSPVSPMIDQAAIRIDGDWADVSVPRCDGLRRGVDEFRLIFFEHRWRFIYTDTF